MDKEFYQKPFKGLGLIKNSEGFAITISKNF